MTRVRAAGKFFREVVLRYEGDECLYWPFSTDAKGYPRVAWNGRMRRAGRVVCETVHGPAPSQQHEAAHSCGAGMDGCLNKRHLRWATPQENTDDKFAHGTVLRGTDQPAAKLTEEAVIVIRSLKGKVRQADLAARFGVTAPAISQIQRGITWAWL